MISSNITEEVFDCVVLGAGPGGSTTAALTAEGGAKTLLLERASMPRFHVGESLMPEVYWSFERLGILDRLNQKGAFTRKMGVQFVTHKGKETKPFIFRDHDDRDCADTFHVARAEFDQILWEKARENGATCIDEAHVLDVVLNDGDEPNIVKYKTADGIVEVQTKVIVDASGIQSIIANRLNLKVVNPDLKKAAIWCYYDNAKRNGMNGSDEPEVTCILNTSNKKCWFWYIPLSDGSVSVGLVGDNDDLLKRGGTIDEVFAEELENCRPMQMRLENATLKTKRFVAKEFSYTTTQHSGDGWVLVGDAYGFIDPVYSSGVFLAFKSGEMAADAIVEGLKNNDVSAKQLGKWTDEFDSGVNWLRKLVRAFYCENFSFGEFIKTYPQHASNLTDLLIGRVYDGEPGAIFEDMDPWLDAVEKGLDPMAAMQSEGT